MRYLRGDIMQGKQSTLTGVAALLFAGGVILMFARCIATPRMAGRCSGSA